MILGLVLAVDLSLPLNLLVELRLGRHHVLLAEPLLELVLLLDRLHHAHELLLLLELVLPHGLYVRADSPVGVGQSLLLLIVF